MTNEPVIALDKLSLKAGNRYLLKDISWQVTRGEHWVVFGMNGCGKTTLLSVLAGYKQPTAGTLQMLGEAYTPQNILDLRRRIGAGSADHFSIRNSRRNLRSISCSLVSPVRSAATGAPFRWPM